MFSIRTQWQRTPNRLHDLAEARSATEKIWDLTQSNPTACGLPYPEEELLAALTQPAALRYSPHPLGLMAAREAVCAYYRERGTVVEPSQLLLTASTSEAYSLLFRLLCNPGEAAVLPTPTYPLFEMLAQASDVMLQPIAMTYHAGWELELDRLAAAGSATRVLLLVHPGNPTGHYISAKIWDKVQELAAARHWTVVVDEVFFDYPAVGSRAPELALRDLPALTFVLNGLSKLAGLPQLKLAWIAVHGPEKLCHEAMARLELLNDLYLSVDAPVQHALPAILQLRQGIQDQIRRRVRTNLAVLDSSLAGHPSLQRLRMEGGWNAVMRLPRVLGDTQWAERLLQEAGVLVHPGHFYEFEMESCLVLGLLAPPDYFREAIDRMLTVVARTLR